MSALRELREKRGLRQETVARYLGVSRQTYAKYERQPQKLSIDQALVLCGILNCTFDDILPGEDAAGD